MHNPIRPAHEVWTIQRRPVDILGRLMIRLDFQLKGWPITVHHTLCKSMEEADEETRRLQKDLTRLMDTAFRDKYKIGHDLRGGY
jgi:hypothetical protein